MKIVASISLIILAVVFTNCNEAKKVIEATASEQLIGKYSVTELNDTKVSKGKAISFEISELNKSIKGTTSCNSFSGNFTKDGYSLRITEMNISESYCDDVLMKWEQSLLRAFNVTGSYIIKQHVLIFYSYSDHSVILKAKKDTIQ
ncbi:MAG: heat shock protein HslJ [Ulvibacter sp.]|jgi:heat shock protein HslJ